MRKTGGNLRDLPVIITGASGNLAGILRDYWRKQPPVGLGPLWLSRGQAFDIKWDILNDPAPIWPEGAVVLHLAGLLRGPPEALAQNSAFAAPLIAACRKNAATALLVASSAAVYAPSATPACEGDIAAPPTAYGQAKLAMEQAFLRDKPFFPLSFLRIGNVVGADALLRPRAAGQGPIVLDPVAGQSGGPLRSWIGPRHLAQTLTALIALAAQGQVPGVLNLCAAPALPMADLLDAAGIAWHYGAPNAQVVPAAVMSNARLSAILPQAPTSAAALAAERLDFFGEARI